jgi:hypothetical protein
MRAAALAAEATPSDLDRPMTVLGVPQPS